MDLFCEELGHNSKQFYVHEGVYMQKLASFIVAKRKVLLTVFLLVGVLSLAMTPFVKITYDMVEYMPDDSKAKQGVEIMYDQFGEVSPLTVMFEGLSEEEALQIQEELEGIPGVLDAMYDPASEQYQKDGYSQYLLTIDGNAYAKESHATLHAIEDAYKDYDLYTAGMLVDQDNSNQSTLMAMGIATFVLLIILFVMCASWFEPFLFLAVIGLAICINMGTNALLPSVSNTTSMIAAILQLALSMDYSIMLIDRYRQARAYTEDTSEAMRQALSHGFLAIAGSSATTIVGLLCLIFMSFRIGMDMGLVLAKGVFISLLCILFVLPGLIITTDRIITKTKKPVPVLPTHVFANLFYKLRYVMVPLLAILFVLGLLMQGKTGIDFYTEMDDPDRATIESVFPSPNAIVAVYDNDDEETVAALIPEIEKMKGVTGVQAYGNTLGAKLTAQEIADTFGVDKSFIDILLYMYYEGDEVEPMTLHAFVTFILDDVMTNEQFAALANNDSEAMLRQLQKLSDPKQALAERTAEDMASYLGIDKETMLQLYMLYFSENGGDRVQEMTLPTFVSFLQKDVLNNPLMASYLDVSMKNQIDLMAMLTNEGQVTKPRSSGECAKFFGISQEEMDQLFAYYFATAGVTDPTTMTVPAFMTFLQHDVLTNPDFSVMMSPGTADQLNQAARFTDKKFIATRMLSGDMAAAFGIPVDQVEIMYYLYFDKQGEANGWTLTVPEFVAFLTSDAVTQNPQFAGQVSTEQMELLKFLNEIIPIAVKNESLSAQDIAELLSPNSPDITVHSVKAFFAYASIVQGKQITSMSLLDFTHLLTVDPILADFLPPATQDQIALLDGILRTAAAGDQLTSGEMGALFDIDPLMVGMAYFLAKQDAGALPQWKMDPYEFISFLVSDIASKPEFNAFFDQATLNQLTLAHGLMTHTLEGDKLNAASMAKVWGMDEVMVERLYMLYNLNYMDLSDKQVSLKDLAAFLAQELQGASPLASQFSDSQRNQIMLMHDIIQGTTSHKAYTSKSLAKMLGVSADDMNVLYYLYTAYYGDISSWKLSGVACMEYLSQKAKDPQFASMMNEENVAMIDTGRKIMHAAAENRTFTPEQLMRFLTDLGSVNMMPDLKATDLQLLYLYKTSMENVDDTREISLSEFMRFILTEIVPDERFSAYLDGDMKEQLAAAGLMMEDGRGALIGTDYSRMIITTDYGRESEEVYGLLDELTTLFDNNVEESYLVGDSAVAWEMHQSFSKELTFITWLTALAIFAIVALTFRSLAVPALLVLLIQTAVYLTMTLSYLQGNGIYYLALIIVQAILMGATIDYAILFTSYYREMRRANDILESLKRSYRGSINTILTSGSILCIVTLAVGLLMSDPTTSQVCLSISKGSFIAILLVLFVLPGVLAALDKIVCRRISRR